ncbi:hypothetical protein [Flavobacterium sp. JAS]|uniref:hypothetical protein n=1 Tax=Flavobacterium sp. JAS TaxID=2897329 RepID=UPI001E2C0A61|nr:hypothetical protein [Flavobacterium sp. JAS]MCD0470486.1 hypothetical protein [Flavobacterium sp. JAS]
MEDYAVVLANDLVVKASNFGGIDNIGFNKQGKAVTFIYEGQKNIALFDFKSNVFLDYVEEGYFNKLKAKEVHKEGDKYDGVEKALWAGFAFKKYDKLIRAQFNDKIYGILRDETGLCYNRFTWIYTNPYAIPVNPVKAPNAPAHGSSCNTFENGTHAKNFFDAFKDQIFYDTNGEDIRLIGEIASLLKSAGEKTAEAFLNFNLTGVDTTKFTFHKSENGYARSEFLKYKEGLELWLKMLKKYKSEISKLGHEEQLFIAIDVMYRHNMLTLLTVDQRISILKILVEKKALMNWYWVNFSIGFVHKEDLAIYILKSFTSKDDADSFLKKLASTNVIKSEYKDHQGVLLDTSYTTLYKMLFYRMDDYAGKDNFTFFVKELQRIVLLKNNIAINVPTLYTPEQLKEITKAQFIWREKQLKNEPKKERVTYQIIQNTDAKLEIKEKIILKTELKEVYYTSTAGIPIMCGYDEVPVEIKEKTFELNHFDLVSIHFYHNPTFIDLTSDATYVGQNFFTFAGFIDYILEKESTKVAEDVFIVVLYTISLAVGFGELIAALRTLNAARAILGIAMISNDTALYLTQNTEFRNYLVSIYGQTRANEILQNMAILSSIASIGLNAVAGSGILKAFSREEALKLVGTGEAILKDSAALEKLLPAEIKALEEAVKRIKNELYSIRNVPEAVETIINTKASVLFDKFVDLKTAFNTISPVDKALFYKNFSSLAEKEIIVLRSIWLASDDVGRIEIIYNSDIWLRNIKARELYLNNKYDELSELFKKPITDSYLFREKRYLVEPSMLNDLEYLKDFVHPELIKAIAIADRTDDVAIISSKLGISENIVQKVKNHYFIDEHFVLNENVLQKGRFERSYGDCDEWLNFVNNPLNTISDVEIKRFKWLISHEYIEAKLMEKGMLFRSFNDPGIYTAFDNGAHWQSISITSGNEYFYPINRNSNIIIPVPNNDLSNLDLIVDKLIDINKL